MRRGETAKLFMSIYDKRSFYQTYLRLANELEAKCKGEASGDPMVATTLKHVHGIQKSCKAALSSKELLAKSGSALTDDPAIRLLLLVGVVAYFAYAFNLGDVRGEHGVRALGSILDLSQKGLAVASVALLLLVLLARSRLPLLTSASSKQ
eukprot:jgi/Botrbrau1/8344/Bobra.0046s0006.1